MATTCLPKLMICLLPLRKGVLFSLFLFYATFPSVYDSPQFSESARKFGILLSSYTFILPRKLQKEFDSFKFRNSKNEFGYFLLTRKIK